MRIQKRLLDSFLPKHEGEWDARLFIDSAIKQNVEFTLEILTKALSGVNEIKFTFHQEPQEHFIYQETDEKTFPKYTFKYLCEAKVDSYCFFGKNKIQLLTQIIDFWAGKESVYPCGGAYFPNSEISTRFEDLSKK